MKIQWVEKQEITRKEGDRHFYIREEIGTVRFYLIPHWGRKIAIGKTDAKGSHYYVELYYFGIMYSQTVLFTKDSDYQFDKSDSFSLRRTVEKIRQTVLSFFTK
jgi:hypothetical protein